MATRIQLGPVGEELAARYLREAGLVILARNWRWSGGEVRGELDIVARDGEVLVFCEVKTRRGAGAGGPVAAVTSRKQTQIRRLAAAFLAQHPGRRCGVRFDVVGVTLPRGGPATLEHLRGAY
jgi:putative endonuclease